MIVKTGEHCGKLAVQNCSPTGKSRVFHHFHREKRGVFHGFNRVFHNFNVDNPFTQWITDWKYTECDAFKGEVRIQRLRRISCTSPLDPHRRAKNFLMP